MFTDQLLHPDHVVPRAEFVSALIKFTNETIAHVCMELDAVVIEVRVFCWCAGNTCNGSPKQPVEEQLAMGKSVILEIEVEGAMKVRAARPDAVFVFILPPSMTELENRLRGRGTEAEEVVQKRVAQAKREIGFAEKYDYVVINDDLSAAIADINAILCAESHKTKKNLEEIKEVLGK